MEKELLHRVEQWVKAHESELIDDLAQLVKIKSVSEPGGKYAMGEGCAKCAHKAMEIGQKWGFETENHDYYCVSVRMKGTGGPELGILGHLDVVPEGEGWSFDPYGAQLQDGYMIGRGAGDNKGACVMSLYAMRCIRELGLPMHSDVRLIFGFNEEAGMEDVEHYLQMKAPPRFTLVCDGAWPMIIGEKGMFTADLVTQVESGNLLELQGGVASNSVPDKAFARVRAKCAAQQLPAQPGVCVENGADGSLFICTEGKACHVMAPEGGVNAIALLTDYLLKQNLLEGDAVRAVQFANAVAGTCYGESLHIENEDELSGKTTCVCGMARLENGKLILNVNSRYAIETDQKWQREILFSTCAAAGFAVENLRESGPRYMPADSQPVAGLLELYRKMTGHMAPPIIMGGGTHARKFPNALPFGPGHWGEPGKFGGAHSVDEAVCLRHLTEALPIYVAALLYLDRFFNERENEEEKHV